MFNFIKDLLTIIHVEVADRTDHLDFFWNNIIPHTTRNFTERHNRWLFGYVNLAADNVVYASDNLRCCGNRIYSVPRR
jgi:hypothetical protein